MSNLLSQLLELKSIMDERTRRLLILSLQGVLIGDSYGAGWEMCSRSYILEHWNELDSGYRPRNEGYNENHLPGMYTDDAEMTIGTLRALIHHDGQVTGLQLVRFWLDEWWKHAQLHGGRCGHGSFKKALKEYNAIDGTNNVDDKETKIPSFGTNINPRCKMSVVEQIDYEILYYQRDNTRGSNKPGNGPLMRQMPILFLSAPNKRFTNTLANAKITHDSHMIVVTSVGLMKAAEFLLLEEDYNSPEYVIDYLLEIKDEWFLDTNDDMGIMLPRLDKLNDMPLLLENDNDLTKSQVPFDLLAEPYAKQCQGDIGLPCKAEQTFYSVLYLIKNMKSTTIYGNLKRCIAFGGDVDTLASIVMSFVIPKMVKDPSDTANLFPNWVIDQLEGKDALFTFTQNTKE